MGCFSAELIIDSRSPRLSPGRIHSLAGIEAKGAWSNQSAGGRPGTWAGRLGAGCGVMWVLVLENKRVPDSTAAATISAIPK